MRLHLNQIFLYLCLAVFIICFSLYSRLSMNFLTNTEEKVLNGFNSYHNISCIINQKQKINCKKENDEIFIPFSFIKKYFEINGVFTQKNGVEQFNWFHSIFKIYTPRNKYDPKGLFMYFENYNVEARDRVKCISAKEGVPFSSQWSKSGHFYPIQIAQFGLSHFSKNLTDPEPSRKIIEDAEKIKAPWMAPNDDQFRYLWIQELNTNVVHFNTNTKTEETVSLKLNHVQDFVMNIDVLLMTNTSSFTITLQNRETKHNFSISYIARDSLISIQDNNIYYGIGSNTINKWKHLTRDLLVDLQKGLSETHPKNLTGRNQLKITSISFFGFGYFDNITLSTNDHLAHFYDAAEWFVNHQNKKTGGWPNRVQRGFPGYPPLRPGWYSAMGQGHAISLLSRAYYLSGKIKYLNAAANGLKPYRILSKNGGVLAKFMNKYNWYEEYPTQPGLFVLNGFIYSLIGLYDLNNTLSSPISIEAGNLFLDGMKSLKTLLPFYDSGSGSFYDLRHFSLGKGLPPRITRWEYHATHVNQLLILATIDKDPIFVEIAERWKGYMSGKRADHN